MVEISLSGSGEGPGWVTAPGYSTAAFSPEPISGFLTTGVSVGRKRPLLGTRDLAVGSRLCDRWASRTRPRSPDGLRTCGAGGEEARVESRIGR